MPSQIRYLVPSNADWQSLITLAPMQPVASITLDFLQALSQCLLKSPDSKAFPELVALGFWLRKANLHTMLDRQPCQTNVLCKALGLVVHFTPANVDTMFVYSWVCSLLMGNNNIVRVASQASDLQSVLFTELNSLFEQARYRDIAQRNCFIQYDKSSTVSAQLCQRADARVIWGGDASVNAIRALPCAPRCRDISFADRYSACLINGDALEQTDLQQLASLLHKDTQPYQQQACSSPRILFWLGSQAQQLPLLEQLNQLFKQQQAPINQFNHQFATSQLMQAGGAATKPLLADAIWALPVNQITPALLDWHGGQGLYLLKSIESLPQLTELLDDKLQSLSYWGIDSEALLKLLAQPSITGVDRCVPVGQALDFSPVWDGFDVFTQLSRTLIINPTTRHY